MKKIIEVKKSDERCIDIGAGICLKHKKMCRWIISKHPLNKFKEEFEEMFKEKIEALEIWECIKCHRMMIAYKNGLCDSCKRL